MRPRCLPILAWILLPGLSVQAAPERPVVAVFSVESKGANLKAPIIESLSEFIAAQLTASGQYTVVPRSELRAELRKQKLDSFKECYDESCQIEIGKELAAQKTVSAKIARFSSTCVVTLVLYDLSKSTSERAANEMGPCSDEGVLALVSKAVAKLTSGSQRSRSDQPKAAIPPAASPSVQAPANKKPPTIGGSPLDSPELQAKPNPTAADTKEARALFQQGSMEYGKGRYEAAVERFRGAYRLSGKTALLYNIANAYERAGNFPKAILFLNRFLKESPNSALKTQVRSRLKQLETR